MEEPTVESTSSTPTTTTTTTSTTTTRTATTTSTIRAPKRRGEGKRLNDNERLEIIQKCTTGGLSYRAAGREYNVTDSAIRKLIQNKELVTERTRTSTVAIRANYKRSGQAKFPVMESKLACWISKQPKVVPPCIVKMKAEQIAYGMGLSNNDFRASDGWHFRFKKRQEMGLIKVPSSTTCSGDEKKKRGQGKRLNDNQRLEIIEKCHAGLSFRAAGREYSVSDSAIRKLMKNEEIVTERSKSSSDAVRENFKRTGHAKFPEMEATLFHWITEAQQANFPLSPYIIKQQAEEISAAIGGEPNHTFKASDGWYFRFKKRHGFDLPVQVVENQNNNINNNNNSSSLQSTSTEPTTTTNW